jgi:hypothetical protein
MAQARLPQAASILSVLDLQGRRMAQEAVTPPGATVANYRILRTDEMDAKDVQLTSAQKIELQRTGKPATTTQSGDDFQGSARKAAKLSLSDATVEAFASVKALVQTLPSKEEMVDHEPKITVDKTSEREPEEERNVTLRAFLHAASRENDNDFHLIVGEKTDADETYMTMEVSGLPPQQSSSFDALNSARDSFKSFFGDKLPGATYDFYDPPIPVAIRGSLFFDMSHAHGQSPGPPTLHPFMPVIWEVHPLSEITFEPEAT